MAGPYTVKGNRAERLCLAKRARHFDNLADKWGTGDCHRAAQRMARKCRDSILDSHILEQAPQVRALNIGVK